MMFTKYLVVVSGNVNIRDYKEVLVNLFRNVDLNKDLIFSRGPLDVLDHSSDNFSFGGKLGIDGTVKHPEEISGRKGSENGSIEEVFNGTGNFLYCDLIKRYNLTLVNEGIPVLIIGVNQAENVNVVIEAKALFKKNDPEGVIKLILAVDHTVDTDDLHTVAWQILGNTDPQRDHEYISPSSLLIDATIKAYRKGGFPRKWPNVVCSDLKTISDIDQKWESLGIGPLIKSPSLKYISLVRNGTDEVLINKV
jgi:4-hydroxy-3-polyprenylbenzoate decarboxylase